jgi:hypothetical protein
VQKLLRRAAAIWRNKQMMRRFNMWCWFCAEAREQDLLNRAAERQRRREAWLLKQLFAGLQDEFAGMDTEPDAETEELRRMAEREIDEVEAEDDEGEPAAAAAPEPEAEIKTEHACETQHQTELKAVEAAATAPRRRSRSNAVSGADKDQMSTQLAIAEAMLADMDASHAPPAAQAVQVTTQADQAAAADVVEAALAGVELESEPESEAVTAAEPDIII